MKIIINGKFLVFWTETIILLHLLYQAEVKQEVQEQELPNDKVGLPQEIAVEPPLPSMSVNQENDELVE